MTEQTEQQKARADEREREQEWHQHDKARDRDANRRQYERAIAEIPNPGPIEPLTELQAFHAEQTDPPPGPYPDPPLGPYPDPVIKERPSEEAVYGRARDARGTQRREAGRKSVAADRANVSRPATDAAGDQARQR